MEEQPVVVFEDEDVSVTFKPVKSLGFFFVSTLSWTPQIEKRTHEAEGKLLTQSSFPRVTILANYLNGNHVQNFELNKYEFKRVV